ncbi:MAG: MBOAT family protein [Clostridia bacterium]|nr:MBOAT family protein [Clostridia bacterium]
MLFNSLGFLIFFPIVTIAYFLLPHKVRWAFLLAASYFFYMCWNAAYALLLLSSTVVTYAGAIGIDRSRKRSAKKALLAASLTVNLGILFIFKYFEFFTSGLYAVLDRLQISYTPVAYSLLLPVGISFFTFQALGYAIDVYRGDVPVQKHFGKYALFVSFFPQLVAGPIERSRNLLPQFDEIHRFDDRNAVTGLRLMLWGYYKKIVIADTVCVAVNTVYNNITAFDGFAICIATFLFAIQIYCDFSGYSDIARGCARIMGFRLMLNFDHPYFSHSVQEFWRRWHISLSTWFKDYIYIPLGGNRKGKARQYVNLMVTFLVSGLWHGANITFVVWGGIHGLFQIVGQLTRRFRDRCFAWTEKAAVWRRLRGASQMVLTFLLVCFAWIFFRANTMSDAVYAVTHLFDWQSLSAAYLFADLKMVFGTRAEFYRLLATLPPFLLVSVIDRRRPLSRLADRAKPLVRWIAYVAAIIYILLFARADMQDFIYFQF